MPRVRKTKPKGILDLSLQLRLDWKAYFDAFCEKHGDPVEWGGRVLFPDGWTYSITSYQGPEYMPPEDPKALLRLQAEYWRVRYERIREVYHTVRELIERLKKAQAFRDGRLYHRYSMVEQNEYGERVRVTHTEPVNLTPYVSKLRELAADLDKCKTERESKINDYQRLTQGSGNQTREVSGADTGRSPEPVY